VDVERLAVDVLHDEVRLARGCGATVEQARDVGVIQAGENLALLVKALEDLPRVHARPDQLDRDALVVGVVVAHCASLGKSPDTEAKSHKNVLNFDLFTRLMSERPYEGHLFGDISAVTQANRKDVLKDLLARAGDWGGRLLNGSDYPLPGVMPVFSLNAIASEGVLDTAAIPVLRELRQSNAIMFDFVLKRSLSFNGAKFPASVFETRDFFVKT